MNIWKRLKKDFFCPNRLREYRAVLKSALDNGYSFVSLRDYHPEKTHQVILRHDVDNHVSIARKQFKIEQQLGIRSTYYFRWITLAKDFIGELQAYGNEVGYHFEEIAAYAYKHNLDDPSEIRKNMPEIQRNFLVNIAAFRKKTGAESVTVASHGDFVNRKTGICNNELLSETVRAEADILHEAYDEDLLGTSKYCSDARGGVDSCIVCCDFPKKSTANYYILVHQGGWRNAFLSNLYLDIRRCLMGCKYRIGCSLHRRSTRRSKNSNC